VNGINAVVSAIREQRPNTVWENCENGGNMMTFNMVQSYVTSVTNDASGALGTRQGTYGATYPFSTRFADRYMPEQPTSTYITRSYLFGGPWHFMNQLVSMTPDATELARKEIQIYKQIREHIRDGKVYHVTPAPVAGGRTRSKVTRRRTIRRSQSSSATAALRIMPMVKLLGLHPNRSYRVQFEDDARVLTMTGEQIAQQGVRVNLPAAQVGEIVYVSPLK